MAPVSTGRVLAHYEIFDVSETQAESVVEPDRVADDLSREPISAIARCSAVHRRTLPAGRSS